MSENATESDGGHLEAFTVSRADLEGMCLGVAVPGAVAARNHTDVLALDPLSDVVDVDALETLWGPRGTSGGHGVTRVTFQYMNYEVTVTRDRLRLEPFEADG